ncbi:MalT transcriptional regulator family protein [Tenacibaculum ovolyticum]|uniref:hypothetical protein n=1 Tax=Tenacibaculum ovolyticum TaxID=104270 RepID=UPI00389915D7
MADNLIISPSITRKHIRNTNKKLKVHNKIEAVLKAKNQNLISSSADLHFAKALH